MSEQISIISSKQYKHGTTTLRFVLCQLSDESFQVSVYVGEYEGALDAVVEVVDVDSHHVLAPKDVARNVHSEQQKAWVALLRTQPGTTGRAAVAATLRQVSKEGGAELPQHGLMSLPQHNIRMKRLKSVL